MGNEDRPEFDEWRSMKEAVERYKVENSSMLESTALRLLLMERGKATSEDMERMIDIISWRYAAFKLLRENFG